MQQRGYIYISAVTTIATIAMLLLFVEVVAVARIKQLAAVPPQVTTSPTATNEWKTYQNDQYGFEFSYPTYWGDVKIEKADRLSITSDDCDVGWPGVPIFGQLAFTTYDQSISFSSAPIEATFTISEVDKKSPFRSVCDKDVNLFELAQKNNNKLPVLSLDDVYGDFYGSGVAWNAEFYGSSKNEGGALVVGAFAYRGIYESAETTELSKYECTGGTDRYCGPKAWFKKGDTSAKFREDFTTFAKILPTFKFIEPKKISGDGNSCTIDSDCVVWTCAGAMLKQRSDTLTAQGVADLPCRNFENFVPKCSSNKCIAVPPPPVERAPAY